MPTPFYSTALFVQIYEYEYMQTTCGSDLNSYQYIQAAACGDSLQGDIELHKHTGYTQTHMYYNLSNRHCITCACALFMSSHSRPPFPPSVPVLLNASITTVGALPWHCDENACFINFVTKSMHSIVQQDKQSGSRISMKSQRCVPVSRWALQHHHQPPQSIPEQYAGENDPQLNLHHLSARTLISFQVNNLLSTPSYQAELRACSRIVVCSLRLKHNRSFTSY